MMIKAWRIVQERHAEGAFSGEGARKYGGRWNSRGRLAVYTSGSLSLAALETLVHLNPPIVLPYLVYPVEFDSKLVHHLDPRALPARWRSAPVPSAVQHVGDHWLEKMKSAVLAVPSAIITQETNYILNPSHHDFQKIRIRKPDRFILDPRLLPSKASRKK
jgi:RES domain-containing protein